MSSRQDRTNVSYRPLWWVYVTVTACLLFVIGMCIVIVSLTSGPVSLSSGPTLSWTKIGFVVLAIGGFLRIIIEGALLAVRHPWGAGFRVRAERRYAHPRLVGLAQVWCDLVVIGGASVFLFVPVADLVAVPLYLPLAAWLVALAPLLALYLFDRRH